ncbi:MAG: transposase [Candidatus Doudnabacteria bacterium]|nr:transposase [Candidatus Doudnabacteria bacterium]
MINNYRGVEDVALFSRISDMLRQFFLKKGFVEVPTQDRLSILAACEDPTTVSSFNYAGQVWPLPQTGQMWLEYELLTKRELPGVFCMSTSYRNESNPVPGRHKIIFPMFEFESRGDFENLRALEEELLLELGFGQKSTFVHKSYDELAKHYQVKELSSQHENQMKKDFGNVVFLQKFPQFTSPFWNMKKDGDYANKIDVIIDGQETIGSAERSTNPDQMRQLFHTISGGKYAGRLYELFGKERVEKELEEFLSLNFFPRFGGGIGMTRLMSAVLSKEKVMAKVR